MEAKQQSRYRKLRIAWSVAWGTVAVLLVAVWVWSCLQFDQIVYRRSLSDYIAVTSTRGKLALGELDDASFSQVFTKDWKYLHFPMRGISNETGGPFAVFPVSVPDSAIFIVPRISSPFVLGPRGRTNYDVSLPYWLLVFSAASVSAVPWIRWRFSVRTLLIATTLVAAVFPVIVWVVKR
jgi:hypothetical protein